jgi:hypothetical protein
MATLLYGSLFSNFNTNNTDFNDKKVGTFVLRVKSGYYIGKTLHTTLTVTS